jgi:glutamyl-tRNA reductase
MKIFVAGLSHHTAPLETRELISVSRERLPDALAALKHSAGGGVLLSTCNRTEVYTLASDVPHGRASLTRFLEKYFGISLNSIETSIYFHLHTDAVRHLFRVSSGLDSMMQGEDQILGQTRDAYGAATKAGTVEGPLNRLFHEALRVGKRARRETDIGREARSISRTCAQLAEQVLGGLNGRKVLIIGIGEAGKLVGRILRQRGVSEIVVANRTTERAQELAHDLGGTAASLEHLPCLLSSADVVIASTGAPGYVIDHETLYRAMERRGGRTLFVVDIAVPRDVEPTVSQIPGVQLYDVDDLDSFSEANRQRVSQEIKKVESIIQEEVYRFISWWDSLSVAPTIADLHEQAEDIRRREVARTLRGLKDLSLEERQRIEALSRSLVQKLLRAPTVALRHGQAPAHIRALRELFGLNRKSS